MTAAREASRHPVNRTRSLLAAAIGPLALGTGLRLICASLAAAVFARWAGDATRHFPRGERALLDNGGSLLFELFYRGQFARGLGPVLLSTAVFSGLAGLVPFGSLVARLDTPFVPLGAAIRRALGRLSALVLCSGVGTLAVTSVMTLVLVGVGWVSGTLGIGPWLWTAALVGALVTAAFGALVDATRVRATLMFGPAFRAFQSGARFAISQFPALYPRYLASVLAQLIMVLAGLVSLPEVLSWPTPIAIVSGSLVVCATVASLLFVRVWFINEVVRRAR